MVEIIEAAPLDPLCLRCARDTDGYRYEVRGANGTTYVLCWDCGPTEWGAEIIGWEATIPADDRLLS